MLSYPIVNRLGLISLELESSLRRNAALFREPDPASAVRFAAPYKYSDLINQTFFYHATD